MLNGCYFWAPSSHLLALSLLLALLLGAAPKHPPALPCTPSALRMVPAKKKAIKRSRNIFICRSPLASLGCAEVSSFLLYNIHESNKIAADFGGLGESLQAQTVLGSPAASCMKEELFQEADYGTRFHNPSEGNPVSLSLSLFKCLGLWQVFDATTFSK